eukprot:200513-Pleurochrysis_carterae.AAC.3
MFHRMTLLEPAGKVAMASGWVIAGIEMSTHGGGRHEKGRRGVSMREEGRAAALLGDRAVPAAVGPGV